MAHVIIMGVAVLTALSLIFSANTSTAGRLRMRASLAGRYERTKVQARAKLHDETLETILRDAGLPLGPALYNYGRLVLTFIGLVVAVPQIGAHHRWIAVVYPLVAWFGLDPRIWWMEKTFAFLRQQRHARLNKDVFLLYRLMMVDLETYRIRKRTVYDMLVQLAPLVPRIRPAITHCLLLWQKSPEEGLKALASEIGTPEVEDLAQVLMTVEQSTVETALVILNGKFETFKRKRIAWFKQRLYVYGLIGSGIAMVGFGAVLLDIIKVITLYTTSIMQAF